MCKQVKSEQQLLTFYDSMLPDLSPPNVNDSTADAAAVSLLSKLSPYMSLCPVGDGNCLFHTVSYAHYASDSMYSQLCLLAVIEVLLFGTLDTTEQQLENLPVDEGTLDTTIQCGRSTDMFWLRFSAPICLHLTVYRFLIVNSGCC